MPASRPNGCDREKLNVTLLTLALAAALALAALPFIAEAFRAPVTKDLQARAPGHIAQLSQGRTHYRWFGPQNGPVAVCIHGLSTPSYVFAATERSLAALGFRVLSYDLYGRGYSDRVRGRQDAAFFLRQLRDLLRDQHVTDDATLIGFSMGAQIATAYAATEGPRVNTLILVAPAGVAPETAGGRNAVWTAPLIGDWLTRVAGGWALRRELVEHRSTATIIPDLEDRQADETGMRGFLPALLSSRRNLLSRSLLPDLAKVAKQDIPILAIWGTEDPIVPLRAMGDLSQTAPETHHAQISGAGHNLLQTHPAQIAERLTRFLKH